MGLFNIRGIGLINRDLRNNHGNHGDVNGNPGAGHAARVLAGGLRW